jgi:hypothetical protein
MNVYQPLDILVAYATNIVQDQVYFNPLARQDLKTQSKYNPDYFPPI